MKKAVISALCLALALFSVFSLAGCANTGTDYDGMRLGKYVKLGSYTVEIPQYVIDDNLKAQVDGFIQNAATSKLIDERGVQKGDTVNIDTCLYTYHLTGNGTNERIAFDTLHNLSDNEKTSLTNYQVSDFGSGTLYTEIEEALIGVRTAETVTVTLTYGTGEDIQPEILRGQTVEIDITVVKIQEITLPEYNDTLVDTITVYKTVAEFEDALVKEIKKRVAWSAFVDSCKIKGYPADRIELYQKEYTDYYNYEASNNQMEIEQYVTNILGITMDEYTESALEYAKATVGEELVLYSVVKKKGIRIKDADYREYCESLLEDYQCETVEELEENYGSELFKRVLYWEQVQEFRLKKVKVTDEPRPEDNGESSSAGENAIS